MIVPILVAVAVCAALLITFVHHQHKLKVRAHLMQEAIRNKDFTFRLPTHGMFFGERAMQETLNQLGQTIREQVNRNEVDSWERLTRVLTHEMMNATAPITSISQSMLGREDVKGTPLEAGIQAIFDTSRHLSDFVVNYRKMSELEKPVITQIHLNQLLEKVCSFYPQVQWDIHLPNPLMVKADSGLLRQVIMNLTKNAIEADATKMVLTVLEQPENLPGIEPQICLYVGNNGAPIPAENRNSLFVPFFTTKRSGSGIGLSLSLRMMVLQGGMLELAEKQQSACHTGFLLTLKKI